MLEEDLRSPCTEEIAVFRAFATAVAKGRDGIVVLDTAPTGHTILLLDAALAYHREVTRQANGMPEAVEHLLPRLRDPDFTRVLIVTLAETADRHRRQIENRGSRAFVKKRLSSTVCSIFTYPRRAPQEIKTCFASRFHR